MAVTEERRHGLHSRLEEVIETQHASTMMELLPPVGWADVATKADLDHLGVILKKDMEIMENRLKASFANDFRTFFITSLTANTAMMAVVVSVAKLF